MSRPSMTALLGLLAIAGYQNRDKIAEWMGGSQSAPSTGSVPQAGDRPSGLDRILPSGGAGGLGSLLHDGLSQIVDQFRNAGHGAVADSWVSTGPNTQIAPPDLEKAIGRDTLDSLAQQTGLSHEEILSRLSKELPGAIDRYTPDGRLPNRA